MSDHGWVYYIADDGFGFARHGADGIAFKYDGKLLVVETTDGCVSMVPDNDSQAYVYCLRYFETVKALCLATAENKRLSDELDGLRNAQPWTARNVAIKEHGGKGTTDTDQFERAATPSNVPESGPFIVICQECGGLIMAVWRPDDGSRTKARKYEREDGYIVQSMPAAGLHNLRRRHTHDCSVAIKTGMPRELPPMLRVSSPT